VHQQEKAGRSSPRHRAPLWLCIQSRLSSFTIRCVYIHVLTHPGETKTSAEFGDSCQRYASDRAQHKYQEDCSACLSLLDRERNVQNTASYGELIQGMELLKAPGDGSERSAFVKSDPQGFFIRHPPEPHMLDTYITPDDQLFQTTHLGPVVVDQDKWLLVVDGLIRKSFALTFEMLRALPSRTITSVHECYGSPVKPATGNLWRVGNVQWTGVSLNVLLKIAAPLPSASFVWSDGLDRGEFFGVEAERYQKDLPMSKAMGDEVLLAYEINGKPLSRKRGGPVRLVVPGWFGTNSTKWISRISLQDHRATGPYTTRFYNEPDPAGPEGALRPVWKLQPNSMIVKPRPGERVEGPYVQVEGWAWHHEPIGHVQLSIDGAKSWTHASVGEGVDFSWQKFTHTLQLDTGSYSVVAKAVGRDGTSQPLDASRDQCHTVSFEVVGS
jgi:DMSO/TMAO reductase YedYZ molybdopterin-dependent catalytic subunit